MTITLTESAMLIFFAIRVEKLLAMGIEPATLGLSSQSGAYDLSATATPDNSIN